MPDVDVFTANELSRLSRQYWLFNTGVGVGIIFAATLGLIVGCAIVSQTIYAATLDRLGEYGTLKALGMSNRTLGFIILWQSLLIGFLGYGVGAAMAVLLSRKMPEWNLSVVIPPWLYVAVLGVTVLICAVSSLTSVNKVFRLSPASVFHG